MNFLHVWDLLSYWDVIRRELLVEVKLHMNSCACIRIFTMVTPKELSSTWVYALL